MTGDTSHTINPTVDGVHPSDLGMKAVTDFYAQFLPPLLKSTPPVKRSVQKSRMQPVTTFSSSSSNDSPQLVSMADTAQHARIVRTSLDKATLIPHHAAAQSLAAPNAVTYVNLLDLGVQGQAFPVSALEQPYDRLPASAKASVRADVWELSKFSTGLFVAFVTNSSTISLSYKCESKFVCVRERERGSVCVCVCLYSFILPIELILFLFLFFPPLDNPTPLWQMPQSGMFGADLFRLDKGIYRNVDCVTSYTNGNVTDTVTIISGLQLSGEASYLVRKKNK